MQNLVDKLFRILNEVKHFRAGYSNPNSGKMLIEYHGIRYVLELREIKNPSKDIMDDLDNLQYM